ncbi:hypothetical protein RB595_004190 [Gaeumannomyces hyphopodioides]
MDGSNAKRYGDGAKGTAKPPRLRRTRFVCISDTHNHTVHLPKGDVLIHAGDLTNQGTSEELLKAIQWLERADFEIKIVVAGNHDVTLDADFYKEYGIYFHNQRPESSSECLDLLESSPSIAYLKHSTVKVRLTKPSGPQTEFTVFGSPYSPRDGLWAFSYPHSVSQPLSPPGPDEALRLKTASRSRARSKSRRFSSGSTSQQHCEPGSASFVAQAAPAEQRQVPDSTAQPRGERRSNRPIEPDLAGPSAEELWNHIPLSADVVITHGPPRGHRDEAADRRRSAGCEALRRALWRIRPRLAVCGHVHEGRGAEVVRWDIEGGPGSVNGRFMEVHGVHRPWEDPAPGGGAKISLVNLTGDVRTGRKPLDNDGGIGPVPRFYSDESGEREWAFVSTRGETQDGVNPLDNTQTCHDADPASGTYGMGGDPEKSARCDKVALLGRMGRRETCVVNCSIMANSYPHIGGKRLNKPIVVDLDLPVWED